MKNSFSVSDRHCRNECIKLSLGASPNKQQDITKALDSSIGKKEHGENHEEVNFSKPPTLQSKGCVEHKERFYFIQQKIYPLALTTHSSIHFS